MLYNKDEFSVPFCCNIIEWVSVFVSYHLTAFQCRTHLTPEGRCQAYSLIRRPVVH